ncbi:MAG: helix-turn-helix transcriptional regulator [Limnothrix sp.]
MSNPNAEQLHVFMVQANIADKATLARLAGVSERTLYRLQHGLIHTFPIATVVQLAQCLQLSVDQFLVAFLPQAIKPINYLPDTVPATALEDLAQAPAEPEIDPAVVENLKAEYQRLETELATQSETLKHQWQEESLDILEAWLLQWSAAADAAKNNDKFPAKTLVTLARPMTELIENWQVTPISEVGEIVEYDPQLHQLVKGDFEVQPGDPVMIQNVGYYWGDRLLHRAKVIT